jgi:hypothetical protein
VLWVGSAQLCMCESGARFLWVHYSESTLTSHTVNVKDKEDFL